MRKTIQNGAVVPLVEIRDEPGLERPPAEPLLGPRAGRWRVELCEQREHRPEVAGRLLSGEVLFTSITWFTDLDAVRGFADDDYEQAVVEDAPVQPSATGTSA